MNAVRVLHVGAAGAPACRGGSWPRPFHGLRHFAWRKGDRPVALDSRSVSAAPSGGAGAGRLRCRCERYLEARVHPC